MIINRSAILKCHVSLWQVLCFSVFLQQTGLKGCFLRAMLLSLHSWHYTLTPAVLCGYSSASFRTALVVSSSSQCVTVSVSDRSCASVDWSKDAGIRTPGGEEGEGSGSGSIRRVHVSRGGGGGETGSKAIGKSERFLPDWWGFCEINQRWLAYKKQNKTQKAGGADAVLLGDMVLVIAGVVAIFVLVVKVVIHVAIAVV